MTTTLHALVTLLAPSEIVTTKPYVPALVNVAAVLFAPFVPFAERSHAPNPAQALELVERA